ncbi:MAG: ribonuclease III, partial [Kiritimatiellae bacterium]|nr:ribonuclease III [Kiritimatiellia bacterium]
KGEERSGGRERKSNLTDAIEAVFGAVYIDGGLKGFKKVFDKFYPALIRALGDDLWAANPKGELQEYSQARWKSSPVYRLIDESGPAHQSVFTVEVEVNGKLVGHGVGSSKQDAERNAAAMALESIEK